MRCVLRCLAPLMLWLASGVVWSAGSDEGMQFMDLQSADRSFLEDRFGRASREVLSTLEPTGGRVQPEVAGFEAASARLNIAAEGLRARAGDPVARRVLRLGGEGDARDLVIVDEVFDPSFEAYHIAAIELGSSDGYARFTVSPGDGVVVGTLYRNGSISRIVPTEDGVGQLMYPISRATVRAERNDLKVVKRPGRAGKLEARHVQMARIAEIQPRRFHGLDSGPLSAISDGDIERLDLEKVLIAPSSPDERFGIDLAKLHEELSAALDRMRPLTMLDEHVSLQIEYATVGTMNEPGKLLVRFNQLIDGVPVEPGGNVSIDPSTGVLRSYTGLLMPLSAALDRSAWLPQESAFEFAKYNLASELGKTSAPVIYESSLRYARKDEEIEPYWLFVVEADQESYYVRVNAITGITQLNPTARH